MSNYKLTYFKIRGRAETARYIFAYSGIKYEENTVEMANWPSIKQCIAGKSNLEQAQVDAVVDTINDFMNMFPWTEKDLAVKQKITEDVFANNIPLLLDGLSKLLEDRMWFVGDSVTWADFHWAVCSITLTNLNVDILHNYPKLLALKERVEALPKIAAWIEQRPKTPL
ncbi:hematopoietic prostaglandin D synthase-like isoform X2 [Mustelus asterias]